MSAARMPRRALPSAPNWLMPMPWPKPRPSNTTDPVAESTRTSNREDGSTRGSPSGGGWVLFMVCTKAVVATSCTPVFADGEAVDGGLVVVVVDGGGGVTAVVDVVDGAGGSVVAGAGGAGVLGVGGSGVGRLVGGDGSGSDADAYDVELAGGRDADDADVDEAGAERAGAGAACSFGAGAGSPAVVAAVDHVRATVSWSVRATPVTGP